MFLALVPLSLSYRLDLEYSDSEGAALDLSIEDWQGAPVSVSTRGDDGRVLRIDMDCALDEGLDAEGQQALSCEFLVSEDGALLAQPRIRTLVGQEGSLTQGRRGRFGREDSVKLSFVVWEDVVSEDEGG